MIIFTRGYETVGMLTHDILGYNDESYANKLIIANQNTFNGRLLREQGFYWPNRALWIPEVSRLDNDPQLRNIILHRCDCIPSWGRANLVKLQKHKVNINHLVGAGKCIRQHNRVNYADGQGIATSLGAQAAAESMFRGAERAAKPAEQFTRQMKNLNNHLKNLVALRKAGKDGAEIQSAREAYKTAYKEAQYSLNHSAKLYARRLSHKASKYLISAKHSELIANKKGIFIDSLDDIKILGRIARYGKGIHGLGYIAIAGLGVDEVYDTYKEGGDWEAKAVGLGVEIGSIQFAGAVMLFFITPAGWIATIAVAIGEGIAYTAGGKFIDYKTEEGYEWIKKHLNKWL